MTSATSERSAAAAPGFRSVRLPDRVARRVLGVQAVAAGAADGAHRAFRISVLVSAIRCLITYLAVPLLVPVLSLTGQVAAPIGLVLCAYAMVNGVVSVRRFWRADHRHRWVYTAFMAVVFVVLAVAVVSDLNRVGVFG
ncbi:MAG: hypothetical protein L0G22_02890 [Propionibacteriaceae bacterium]|nr:hypothetical protein [Propionibacteriaceae bacterium]